jgi:hypothetical protein
LVFLPAYLLAAPRRAHTCLLGFLTASALLFAPYLGEIHQLYADSVTWQLFHRIPTPLSLRVETTAIFWLIINPLALAALFLVRKPPWLMFGFATGTVFVLTASAYSHYFVSIAPFAALLGAPLAIRFIRIPTQLVVAGCLALTIAWAAVINLVAQPYVPISRFSDIRPVITLIDRSIPPGTPMLANRFEFAYLAQRPWVAHYFWDDYDLMSARFLEQRLPRRTVVVWYPLGSWYSFPPGFRTYLDARYRRLQVGGTSIWLVSRVAWRS